MVIYKRRVRSVARPLEAVEAWADEETYPVKAMERAKGSSTRLIHH